MVKDEIGNKYNKLTVISRGPNDNQGNARWWCSCDCGNPNLILAHGYALRNGHKKSCGCLHLENAKKQGMANKKNNIYDLSGVYGVGYTLKNEPFYFDLEDYDLIKDYCWHINKDGYVVCKRKKLVLMHRLVMHAPEDKIVDHIFHNKNDNRKENLRLCTKQENSFNKKISHSASKICGVYWYSNLQKWSAEIVINGNKIHLGFFNKMEEAIKIRKEAELKYFGEYAYKEGDDNCVYN